MRAGRWGIAYVNNVGGANVIKDVGHLLIIRTLLQRGRAHPMRTHALRGRRTVWSSPPQQATRSHKNQRLPSVGSQPDGDCQLHPDAASAASGGRTSIDACAAASGAAAAALVMMEAAAGAAEDSSAIDGRSAMVRPRD